MSADDARADGLEDTAKVLDMWKGYGYSHMETIKKFGRFPHRNEVLGRESTPEEIEYLTTAQRYGQ